MSASETGLGIRRSARAGHYRAEAVTVVLPDDRERTCRIPADWFLLSNRQHAEILDRKYGVAGWKYWVPITVPGNGPTFHRSSSVDSGTCMHCAEGGTVYVSKLASFEIRLCPGCARSLARSLPKSFLR